MEAPKQKVLCVCERGDNRSVHLAYILKHNFYEAIPVGWKTASYGTLLLLRNWADIIMFLDETAKSKFEEIFGNDRSDDSYLIDVGRDVYTRPLNIELKKKLDSMLSKKGFI